MSRRAKKHTTLFSFAVLLLALPVWWGSGYFPVFLVAAAPVAEVPSAPPDFQVTLIRAGLPADVLSASGVGSGSIGAVLQAVASKIAEAPSALASADAAYAAARVEADGLQRLIQSGQGTPQDVGAYQTASASLASATASRQAILDGLFMAGTTSLTSAQRAALTRIRANRSWELPLEFLVVDRPEAEWVHLRDALANERIALDLPDSLNPTAQSSLATWRADGSVAAAKAAFDSNLGSVTSAWNTASGD